MIFLLYYTFKVFHKPNEKRKEIQQSLSNDNTIRDGMQ